MEYAIEMQGVTKRYHRFCLDGIDFQVPKGCVMGLIGENGAGKTTLIKAALGLIRTDAGEVRIEGKQMKEAELAVKEDLGVVFDNCSFPEELTVANIRKLMRGFYRKWDETEFDALTTSFGLPEDKKIKEFSKGMKMKLSIAVALSHHAKLLILDEATSGLDPVVRDEILDLFLDFMQDEEHSILFSSHITSDLEKIADYITFLKNGTIVFSKSRDDLISNYGILKCRKKDLETMDSSGFVAERENAFDDEVLLKNRQEFVKKYPEAVVDPASVEDIILFYVRGRML